MAQPASSRATASALGSTGPPAAARSHAASGPASTGDRVRIHSAVRAYWLGQWEVIDPEVHPRRVRELPDGRVEVLVEQDVRDADGDLLSHAFVLHTYTFTGDLISRMDVGDPSA